MKINLSNSKFIDSIGEKLRATLLFFTLLSIIGACKLQAQVDSRTNFSDELWADIETQLDQQKTDTAFFFIIQSVRNQCENDFDCLYDTYVGVRRHLEVKFNLPAAVFVSHEMVRVAKEGQDVEGEGHAYLNLRRFYNAMKNEELAAINTEKALKIFEETDNQHYVAILRMSKLEDSLIYKDYEEVVPEMEALLVNLEAEREIETANMLHLRMVYIHLAADKYEKASYHIDKLEKTAISNPMQEDEYGYAIPAALGRANIAEHNKDLIAAEMHYRRALSMCEEQPSRWLEISTLHSLANLEWERGNVNKAKSYLKRAKPKAEKLEIDEFLVDNHAFQAKIAEKEGRYADALVNTKKEYFYQKKIEDKSKSFQLRNYHLQLETEQLKTEKEKQAYDLALQDSKLQSQSIIIGLGVLLTSLLIFGFYFQRKRKKELAAQNALIQKQAERLATLDSAKSRFFANVSHELRTPLTLLLGPLNSALKSGTLDSRNSQYLRTAQRSGKDLLKLVGSILDLSKLESGKLKLEENAEMFYPLTRRIASTFESYAQQSKIEFTFLYTTEDDLKLKLDRKKFETIVNNLLSNAMKFTPAGGKIEMIVEDIASNIRLTVKDTGRGIHPNDLPHIFNRFYQSEQIDAPTEGGTGIGLSLCQNLIKLMGGEIGVESTTGKGSTFYIEFPRKEILGTREVIEVQEEDLADQKAVDFVAKTNKTDTNLPTIMIVEDNRSLQEYIKSLLSPFYQVVTAENGQKALEKLEDTKNQPSLILSDVMMPVMDGFQFLKELKSKDNLRHLPVVMLTARADIQDKLRALRTGVDDYLLKPFEEEELLVRIENLLDNQVARKVEIVKEKPQKATFTISAKDKIWLEEFETYVKENLTSHLLTVPNLARNFAMSESSLLRQLKSLTGLSPIKYLQEVRLEKARILLEKGTFESIARVANEVGYSDARTFSRSYKKRFGKLPSEVLQLQ